MSGPKSSTEYMDAWNEFRGENWAANDSRSLAILFVGHQVCRALSAVRGDLDPDASSVLREIARGLGRNL